MVSEIVLLWGGTMAVIAIILSIYVIEKNDDRKLFRELAEKGLLR